MIIVTSYVHPDLDGVACTIAYTELLSKQGKIAKGCYSGQLGLEIQYVRNFVKEFPLEIHEDSYESDTEFVLVDTSDPDALDKSIDVLKVKKIFDHRELVSTDSFTNSQNQIDLVGSCATLITEEFQKASIKPSEMVATYLYSAISSNTINFQNTAVTKRDKEASEYLINIVRLPDDFIHNMFISKSKINVSNIFELFTQELAIKVINNKRIGIIQIEIVKLEETLIDLKEYVEKSLHILKEENNLDFLIFTGIDVIEGYNLLITIDDESKSLISKSLNRRLGSFQRVDGIIMRKQIWPLINSNPIF